MPEDVRKQYEQAMNSLKDKNRNQIPDAFENMSSNVVVSGNMKIIVDGKNSTAWQIYLQISVPDTNRQWANWMQPKWNAGFFGRDDY
jgi:hypothetical protein